MSSKNLQGVAKFVGDLSVQGTVASNAALVDVDLAVTATASGVQNDAYQIVKQYTEVTTCATALDSLKLPNTSGVGFISCVINNGAAECAVYPCSGGTIDGRAANAYYPIYNGSRQRFLCTGTNTWITLNNGTRYIDIAEQAGYHWADTTTRADAPGGSLTIDSEWHDLTGLSGYIPKSAYGNVIHLGLYCYEDNSTNAEDYFTLRTPGHTEPHAIGFAGDADRTGWTYQWPSPVLVSSTGTLEYNFNNTTPDQYGIWILGWWVKG